MMFKNGLALLLFFSFLSLSAQTRKVTLNWGNEPSSPSFFNQSESTTFVKSSLNYEAEENRYTEQWVDDGFAVPSSVQIRNVVFEDLSEKQVRGLNKDAIPSEVNYSVTSSKGRSTIYTILNLSPIIYKDGRYKKVVSLEFAYRKSTASFPQKSLAVTQSVLRTGNWYKFKIDKKGIYRVNRSFLSSLGMDVNTINPAKLKIYGNGGKMLPLLNSENNDFDPVELAIQVVGGEDGSFDANDFILFYGENNIYNQESNTHLNIYDDDAYYYITADGVDGKRILPATQPTGSATTVFSRFHHYQFHELDEMNPALVGRRWFGNRFDINNEQSFDFVFPNIVAGQPVEIKVVAIASSDVSTSLAVSVNGQDLGSMNFAAVNNSVLALGTSLQQQVAATSENIQINLSYNNSGNPGSLALLDYISLEAVRQLSGTGEQMEFYNKEAGTLTGIGEYQLSNAAQYTQVWDVTDPAFVTALYNEGSSATFNFKAQLGEVKKYIAVHPGDYYAPIQAARSSVPNQDLKGTIFLNDHGNFQDIDYLIITAPFLLQPALRLANHHRTLSGLNVKVVTTDKIYTEFSAGKQDIAAIRNFVKYVYDNASSEAGRLKYLGIFGDTSVDYKNRLQGNNNIIPSFHRYTTSLSTASSFMSDDFFGSMDPTEGTMDGTDKLDIAVGRILADNVSLANAMVDKVINYASKASYGNWRNNFVLISDDVDEAWEFQDIQLQLDNLGNQIGAQQPFVNVIKIHSDAFQQQTSAGGNRYPKVNEEIKNSIDVGALIMNYFGHGGEDGLAKEFIVTKSDMQNLRNTNRYPLFITVTCEFTRFDNPLRPTGGEFTYWNREGGAIALITTTRAIGVGLGVDFNQVLAEELYAFGTNNFIPPAEALRRSKNQISNALRRVIFYIGDPAMELAYPKQQVRLITINDQPIGPAADTLKALSKIKFGGEVVDENGQLQTGYNGILEAKVFDKQLERQTLGNDGTTNASGELLIMDFETLGEGVFNGQASVVNGLFEFEFVVPRDIAIPIGNGRVSLYTQKNQELKDHTGANEEILIGGLNANAPEDNIGPHIRLFMNDESFVSGGITNNSPILIAKLEDENGINTASGIGHDIIAILDGDESNPYVLNDYYQSDIDNYSKGSLNYRLRNLEEGLHTLTIKAWDVYNNSSTSEIQFVVAGSDELRIERVLNYPNPFISYTEFWFNHNRPFEPLEVQVQIFTVTGKIVWTRNQVVSTDGFLSRDIVWDGRDDFGDRIGKGVYVYKLTVKSTLTNKKVEKFEKLVIL